MDFFLQFFHILPRRLLAGLVAQQGGRMVCGQHPNPIRIFPHAPFPVYRGPWIKKILGCRGPQANDDLGLYQLDLGPQIG